MKTLKNIILMILSTVYIHANYELAARSVQAPVHPIAQICNENARRIEEFLEEQGINLSNFFNIVHDDFQNETEEQLQLRIYILYSWVIFQNMKNNSYKVTIIAQ